MNTFYCFKTWHRTKQQSTHCLCQNTYCYPFTHSIYNTVHTVACFHDFCCSSSPEQSKKKIKQIRGQLLQVNYCYNYCKQLAYFTENQCFLTFIRIKEKIKLFFTTTGPKLSLSPYFSICKGTVTSQKELVSHMRMHMRSQKEKRAGNLLNLIIPRTKNSNFNLVTYLRGPNNFTSASRVSTAATFESAKSYNSGKCANAALYKRFMHENWM